MAECSDLIQINVRFIRVDPKKLGYDMYRLLTGRKHMRPKLKRLHWQLVYGALKPKHISTLLT